MRRKKLLILFDYFYPGYKAGGPVQSLTNLAVALNKSYDVFVITNNCDMGSKHAYKDIITNQWNGVNLAGDGNTIQIFYTEKSYNRKKYLNVIDKTNADVIYFNNIYSYFFFRLPLLALQKKPQRHRTIICPRGMLQQGALSVKPFKKKIYLAYLRYAGLLDNMHWHATDKQEANDIRKHFPKNKGINIAANIPKPPLAEILYPAKKQEYFRLVYLSLIAEKKNLLLLLKVIQASGKNIVLDIYGPVTDKSYWKQCQFLIHKMPGKAVYKGEVEPAQVQQVLSQYHALILLTKGENFGHALYESLSVGRPVITSYFTPWNELQQKKAGLNVDINDLEDCFEKLNNLANTNQKEYNSYCEGAHHLALQYYQSLDTEVEYVKLFG